MKNIVILGAGNTGSYLASKLSSQGHNVVVIDRDTKALERIALNADIAIKQGSGTDWRLLAELKDMAAGYFIALSSNDECNLTACAIAKRLGFKKTVARIRQSSFLDYQEIDFNELFSVDHILGTEVIIAHEILKCILNPGNIAAEDFAHGAVQMRAISIPVDFGEIGKPLAQIKKFEGLLVGLIRRKGEDEEATLIFPRGSDALLPGDEITLIGRSSAVQAFQRSIGVNMKQVRSAVVVGGEGVAMHLVTLLLEHGIKVKIFEGDEQRCRQLAKQFPEATVFNHEGTDLDFLKEECVDAADAFIACTEKHETNILVAMMGKQAGCNHVIALVSDENSIPLLQKFDIAYSLSAKASIERRIELILHQETHISLASLYENQAKVMEVRLTAHSKLAGKPLSELSSVFPEKFLLAMAKTKQGIIIPKGSSTLMPGDTAIVLCCPENMQAVENIL